MKVYSDGGARGNPGPAAIGFLIKTSSGKKIIEESAYIGESTNNVAEYVAIITALNWCLKNNITDNVICYLDSLLVVNQINGKFKVKNANIKKLHSQLQKLKAKFKIIHFYHIPRSENSEADSLVNAALDTKLNSTLK